MVLRGHQWISWDHCSDKQSTAMHIPEKSHLAGIQKQVTQNKTINLNQILKKYKNKTKNATKTKQTNQNN